METAAVAIANFQPPQSLSATDTELAQNSSQRLTALLGTDPERLQSETVELVVRMGNSQEEIAIPASAIQLLANILSQMALGNPVTFMPVHAELTTQQAADILNVSRPYLVGLLEAGDIPHHKVGTHRRVRLDHLMSYKKVNDEERSQVLAELTREAQELDMGY